MTTLKKMVRAILLSPYYANISGLSLYERILHFIKPSLSDVIVNKQFQRISRKVTTINHITNSGVQVQLTFCTPNLISKYRADTFSTKEPETLLWIDRYGGDGAFFDIGANIGTYSIYHAATHPDNVYAFEPSGFNIGLLSKNININHLQEKIQVIQTPLSNEIQFCDFHMIDPEEGSARSAFGVTYGHDGQMLDNTLFYKTFGLTLDYLINQKILQEYPALIKIDVDGIEDIILQGSRQILKNPKCKTILVEVNLHLPSSAQINNILHDHGFTLQNNETQSEYSLNSRPVTTNQIWIRI